MSRKVVRLTVDHLAQLEGPCRSCLFWQLDPVSRARIEDEDAATEKETWVSQVLRDWGSCGRVALVDDEPVGYLIYAPSAFLPGAAAFPTAPVSSDAVLLTNVWVHPDHAGGGLGRMLVQGMARDLIKRGGIRAVEAFGDMQAGEDDEGRSKLPELHGSILRDYFANFALSASATASGTNGRMLPPMEAIWRTSVAVIVRTEGLAGRKTVCSSGAMVSFMPAICIS